jgi:hypothetical protein
LNKRSGSVVVGLASVVLAACAGNAAMQAAHDAHYQGDRSAMLDVVLETVQSHYKIDGVNAETGIIVTRDRWYEKDGTYEDHTLDSDQGYVVEDRSILLRYEVHLRTDGTAYRVEVTPIIAQHRVGYAAPFKMKPDDLEVPGWIHGKTEKLTLAIYDALASYRVAPVAAVAER